MIKTLTIKSVCIIISVLSCVACQRGNHQTAGAPEQQDGPAYTVGADYNKSPASNK